MNAPLTHKLWPCGSHATVHTANVWFIQADNEGCEIALNNHLPLLTVAGTGVLAVSPIELNLVAGSAKFYQLNVSALAKLQVFLDMSASEEPLVTDKPHGYEPLPIEGVITFKKIEYWFISQFLSTSPGMSGISSVLRNTESYWLINFLLEQAASTGSTETLKELGARYGLSVSHFRRLTRKALGNTTKVEMCDWRLAKALLDFAGEKKSLTDLAMKHGYASLSHFSNDVRNMLGISPRSLKNIIFSDAIK